MPRTKKEPRTDAEGNGKRSFLRAEDLSILQRGKAPRGVGKKEAEAWNHTYHRKRRIAMERAQEALGLLADLFTRMDAEWVAEVATSGTAERGLHLERVVREGVGAVGWGRPLVERGGSGAFFAQHMAAAIQGGLPVEGAGEGASVEIRLPAVGFLGRTPDASGPTFRGLQGRQERGVKALRAAVRRAPRPRKGAGGGRVDSGSP